MKCALVTGGSRGIGKAICLKMAEMGYHVLVNFQKNSEQAEDTLARICKSGGSGELLQFDISEKAQVNQILGKWINGHVENRIEVLVNNAAIKDDSLMFWMKDDQWERVVKTNLNSFFFITRLVLNGMLHNRYGRIINMVSISGLKGLPGQTNYSAAKAGLIGATKALAQEVGRQGITVNAIAPGLIRTEMSMGMDEAELRKMIPANRFGLPEEVAFAVGFLASPGAGYISGQVLSVNGGLYS